MVRFIDDYDFEPLPSRLIYLLGLRNLFEKILNDYSVESANIGGCDFQVVYRRNDVEFEFAVGGCLEYTGVNLDLLDSRSVELS